MSFALCFYFYRDSEFDSQILKFEILLFFMLNSSLINKCIANKFNLVLIMN